MKTLGQQVSEHFLASCHTAIGRHLDADVEAAAAGPIGKLEAVHDALVGIDNQSREGYAGGLQVFCARFEAIA